MYAVYAGGMACGSSSASSTAPACGAAPPPASVKCPVNCMHSPGFGGRPIFVCGHWCRTCGGCGIGNDVSNTPVLVQQAAELGEHAAAEREAVGAEQVVLVRQRRRRRRSPQPTARSGRRKGVEGRGQQPPGAVVAAEIVFVAEWSWHGGWRGSASKRRPTSARGASSRITRSAPRARRPGGTRTGTAAAVRCRRLRRRTRRRGSRLAAPPASRRDQAVSVGSCRDARVHAPVERRELAGSGPERLGRRRPELPSRIGTARGQLRPPAGGLVAGTVCQSRT